MKIWTNSLTHFDDAEAFEFDRLLQLLSEVGNIEQGIQLERALWRRRLELATLENLAIGAQVFHEQLCTLGRLEEAFRAGCEVGRSHRP